MKKITIEVTDEVYEKLMSRTNKTLNLQSLINIIISKFFN